MSPRLAVRRCYHYTAHHPTTTSQPPQQPFLLTSTRNRLHLFNTTGVSHTSFLSPVGLTLSVRQLCLSQLTYEG